MEMRKIKFCEGCQKNIRKHCKNHEDFDLEFLDGDKIIGDEKASCDLILETKNNIYHIEHKHKIWWSDKKETLTNKKSNDKIIEDKIKESLNHFSKENKSNLICLLFSKEIELNYEEFKNIKFIDNNLVKKYIRDLLHSIFPEMSLGENFINSKSCFFHYGECSEFREIYEKCG